MSSVSNVPLSIESKAGKCFVVLIFFSFLFVSIWFTPVPNAPEISCDRPCHELDWPRICRLRFILESHSIYNQNCSQDGSQCLKEDFGFEPYNNILTVNRQIPGPKIHACVHDILLIDVVNQLPDKSVTLHWRGQVQRNEPIMDGVPMITQCPISSFTTFQYKFRVSSPGTHLWHLHNHINEYGNQNHIYGMLVVRESARTDTYGKIINYDDSEHAITIKSVKNQLQQAEIVINGRLAKDKNRDLIEFSLRRKKSYRFRIGNIGGDVKCPIVVTVNGHKLLVIALDGNSIEPIYTNKFIISSGERLDFILCTDQLPGKYSMEFSFVNECGLKASSFITFNYTEDVLKDNWENVKSIKFDYPYKSILSTSYSKECKQTTICLEEIQTSETIPEKVLEREIDTVLYLIYDYQKIYLEDIKGMSKIGHINNISFAYPSSPLLSQFPNNVPEAICSSNTISDSCRIRKSNICECTHVINVEEGSVVELILVHRENEPKRDHIFHLHGHKFYVLGRSELNKLKTTNDIKTADEEGSLVLRNLKKPALKDTLVVPRGGVAVIRFLADNAGYWLFREEGGEFRGMEVIFNVIGSQYNVPGTFPRCGNWIGPKYFLA